MTTIAYKLLSPDLTTHNGCQWVVGETKRTSGEGDLCGPGWLHGYEHAELAHFLNPIHANFKNPILYEVRVGGKHLRDGPLKSGWTEMTLVALADVQIPTTEQRVRFAIACALSTELSLAFRQWAYNWLDGVNRTARAAWVVECEEGSSAWEARAAARAVVTWEAWATRVAAAGAARAVATWEESSAWEARAAARAAARAVVEEDGLLLSAAHFAMSERRRL